VLQAGFEIDGVELPLRFIPRVEGVAGLLEDFKQFAGGVAVGLQAAGTDLEEPGADEPVLENFLRAGQDEHFAAFDVHFGQGNFLSRSESDGKERIELLAGKFDDSGGVFLRRDDGAHFALGGGEADGAINFADSGGKDMDVGEGVDFDLTAQDFDISRAGFDGKDLALFNDGGGENGVEADVGAEIKEAILSPQIAEEEMHFIPIGQVGVEDLAGEGRVGNDKEFPVGADFQGDGAAGQALPDLPGGEAGERAEGRFPVAGMPGDMTQQGQDLVRSAHEREAFHGRARGVHPQVGNGLFGWPYFG